MILVDTNVVSELMRPRPSQAVLEWLNHSDTQDLFVSMVSVAEIYYGLEILADGSRKVDLLDRFRRLVATAFDHRVLDFDEGAARAYGLLMARRRSLGRPMSTADGQIAAIARTHSFVVATRNGTDFEACDLDILNPFEV